VRAKVGMPYILFTKCPSCSVFFTLLCFSNIAPATRSSYDPTSYLRRGDVSVINNVLYINLRWSKN
jgi:hypothetical protein